MSSFQDSPLPAVDTTRVKLHSLEGDDDLPVTLSSPFPPSPPPSQDTSPMRSSPTPRAVQESGKAADERANTSDGVSPMGVRFSRTVQQESADTTISELNSRRMPIEVEGKLRSSVVGEDGSSETTARELCGITLKRSDVQQKLNYHMTFLLLLLLQSFIEQSCVFILLFLRMPRVFKGFRLEAKSSTTF